MLGSNRPARNNGFERLILSFSPDYDVSLNRQKQQIQSANGELGGEDLAHS
jgi:hypothetical protein